MNSLSLKFLFHPFKTFYVFCLIMALILGSSMAAQTYFDQVSFLKQEMAQMNSGNLNNQSIHFNIQVAYVILSMIFFNGRTSILRLKHKYKITQVTTLKSTFSTYQIIATFWLNQDVWVASACFLVWQSFYFAL